MTKRTFEIKADGGDTIAVVARLFGSHCINRMRGTGGASFSANAKASEFWVGDVLDWRAEGCRANVRANMTTDLDLTKEQDAMFQPGCFVVLHPNSNRIGEAREELRRGHFNTHSHDRERRAMNPFQSRKSDTQRNQMTPRAIGPLGRVRPIRQAVGAGASSSQSHNCRSLQLPPCLDIHQLRFLSGAHALRQCAGRFWPVSVNTGRFLKEKK